MLRGMTAQQLMEWRAYDDLEPFSEERADLRTASIVAALYNINRDAKKHRNPFPLSDFVLRFGEEKDKKKKQTWQEQKAALIAFASMHNAMVLAAEEKKNRRKKT